MENNLFEQGEFFFGCNWWASHAGTNMWHDWDAAVVEEDIKKIKEAKASTAVNVGDIIEIKFGEKIAKFEVMEIKETTKKELVKDMVKVL